MAFWRQSSGNPATQNAIFGLGNNWEVRELPNGIIVFDLCGEGSNNFVTTRPLVETGRWYHVAATFDSATDSYAVCIDGQTPDKRNQQQRDDAAGGGSAHLW